MTVAPSDGWYSRLRPYGARSWDSLAAAVIAALTVSPAFSIGLQVPADQACKAIAGATCLEEGNDFSRGEVDGMGFKLFYDGSGTAQVHESADAVDPSKPAWYFTCSRDAVSGLKYCNAHAVGLWIEATNKGALIASVGSNQFPGSVTSLRVGDQRFDTTDRDGRFTPAASARIIKLMSKDGAKVATRFMEWPYRSWNDSESEMHGVGAVVKILQWSVGAGK